MKMKNSLVSVVMPVYNRQDTVGKSLKSIFENTYKNFEVIVVDDNSKDNSVKIARQFPCKIIRLKKNMGGGFARNKGAESAKGEILLFVDSDVIIPKNAMEFAVNYFSKHPEVTALLGLFSTNMVYKNIFSNYKHLYLRYYFLKQKKCVHTLNTSLTFIKKDIFKKFRGFDTNIKSVISEDAELGMRLTENGCIIHQSKVLEMGHLKYYSFKDFLDTEFIRSRRIFTAFANKLSSKKEKKMQRNKFFFFRPINIYLSIPLVYLIILSFMLSKLNLIFFQTGVVFLGLFIAINFDFWRFLKKERNLIFSIKSSFVTFLSMVWMGIGIMFGIFDLAVKFVNKS